jgi:uncharacterized protein YukE
MSTPRSGQLRVDAAALRANQPALAALADGLTSAVMRLGTALDGEGPCWGFDEPGRAFGDTYAPAARQVREALGHAGERLGELRDAVGALADVAEAADDQARQRLA